MAHANRRVPLRGLGDTAPDYSPSWFDVVGTMRQLAPALAQAKADLTNALAYAVAQDDAADPDGFSTPNADAIYAQLSEVTQTAATFNSIAGALNSVSALFPGGPIQLAGLGGILPDSIGGWTLTAVLGFFAGIPAMLAGVVATVANTTGGASAPTGGLVGAVTNSIERTNAAVNQAIQTLSNLPGQIGAGLLDAQKSAMKALVVGGVVYLLGSSYIKKHA